MITNNGLPSFWVRNPKAAGQLTRLWLQGYSASYILGALGAENELTRNSIISKAHRLGLPPHERGNKDKGRRKPYKAKATEKPKKRQRLRIKVEPEIKPVIEMPIIVPTFEATGMSNLPFERPATAVHVLDVQPGQCRWPVGHDGEGLFCGAVALEDVKMCYCIAHYNRAVSPQFRQGGRSYDYTPRALTRNW